MVELCGACVKPIYTDEATSAVHRACLSKACQSQEALTEQRDQLLAALKDMAQMRWFVMAYDGHAFDKPRMIAMLDRADTAIAKAEGQ